MAPKRASRRLSSIKKPAPVASKTEQTDAILPMQEPYMQQIVKGEKTYEFRKYLLKPSVQRIWFYRTAPHSSIEYVCNILPAKTRNPADAPLEENGLGNQEFNSRHNDWKGYDYAYKILSVYHLNKPITLNDLKVTHNMKAAPRGLVYTPSSMTELRWQSESRMIIDLL
ncbi:MAG: hypothetical protein L6R38_008470 [Xanthoria sp. 2 TBL-2021]|nr:MAG: hypothetical protein L6R38_008470 [Xanthoria sp. 2 TBL-2021]